MFTHPDLIKLVHGMFYDFRLIGQDARFEVTSAITLHSDAGTSEIGAADIRLFTIKDYHLEMHPWAKHPLQPIIQNRESVKVLPEVWPRFLGMNKSYLHSFLNQLGQHLQERLLALPILDIQILDVCRTNPQRLLHGFHPRKHFFIVSGVGDVGKH